MRGRDQFFSPPLVWVLLPDAFGGMIACDVYDRCFKPYVLETWVAGNDNQCPYFVPCEAYRTDPDSAP